MKEYDVTILESLLPTLWRGRLRKAKRMIGVLISRAKTPVDLVEINGYISQILHQYSTGCTGWHISMQTKLNSMRGGVYEQR